MEGEIGSNPDCRVFRKISRGHILGVVFGLTLQFSKKQSIFDIYRDVYYSTSHAQPFRQSTLSRAIQFCLATRRKLTKNICKSHGSQGVTRKWFQTFFIFNLTWGDDPMWLIFFKWVETTNQVRSKKKFHLKAGRILDVYPASLQKNGPRCSGHPFPVVFFFFKMWKIIHESMGRNRSTLNEHILSIGWQRNHQLAFF